MTSTSRERVIAALEHREPDRVPIDFAPQLDFYLNLKHYLGLEVEEDLRPNLAMEVVPHPQVLETLGADLVLIPLTPGAEPAGVDVIQDAWGVGYRRVSHPGGGSHLEVIYNPLANASSMTDLEKYAWPDPVLPGCLEATGRMARGLYENTGLALVGRFGGSITGTAANLLGFEKWLVTAALEPELAGAILDRITDIIIAQDAAGLSATAEYLQVLRVGNEDLGTQTGPLYSMRLFRSLLLPRLERRWQAARHYLDRANPGVKILLRSCGSVRRFIPDLIQAGIQVLDPLQPLAAEMDPAELKNEFGGRLSFHGGVDIQKVLSFGSEADVCTEVQKRIRALGPGGGYIVSGAHTIQADTPPASLVAMCKAARTYGAYPLQ
ncbi:MAG: uroporphyrinogen decarboxylase family protein [Anaerolineaceae bacterium]|nr:uroporphyrinogen decarboxylase family protein [Anaerolineaceae bacterium]